MSDPTKDVFTHVHSSDWMALYQGDKKVAEGHSLSPRDVLDILDALGFTVQSPDDDIGDKELETVFGFSFPDSLAELRKMRKA